MMDNGYPQTTEIKLLKGFIKTESYEFTNPFTKKTQLANSIEAARQVSNVVSWRQEGIKYSKNEFYLDVVEKLSMLIGPNNNIIKSEIIGAVNADCQLSGMPDLKLGLNDKAYYEAQGRTSKNKSVEFNDIKFHQCVRLGRF
jgi:AP-1 complex subunit mu